jgi:hypothetical protein
MKTRRFGIDIKPELETLMREVNADLGLVYREQFSEDAFRKVESRLNKLMRAVGDDSEKRSIVQGAFNQLAHARLLADAHMRREQAHKRPR